MRITATGLGRLSALVNKADVFALVNYVFKGGP